MLKKFMLGIVAANVIAISGCTTFADFAGADTATLNATASQGFTKMKTEAQQKGVLDTSSSTYRRINNIMQRMIPYANQLNQTGQPFQWQLAVLKQDTVNAYVAPGGKVVFYTGIVNKLNLSDDEIAAVMGHEMTHALEEHSKSKIGAEGLTSLAINLGKAYGGQTVGQFGSVLDLGGQIGVGLPYSRNLESRADHGGLLLMAKAGYNPQAAITLWQKMNRLDGGAGGPAFLSTHPTNTQRIQEMQKNLPAAMAIYNSRKN